MPNVRFYIDAEATCQSVEFLSNIDEVNAFGIELDDLIDEVNIGRLSIDSITFENLED